MTLTMTWVPGGAAPALETFTPGTLPSCAAKGSAAGLATSTLTSPSFSSLGSGFAVNSVSGAVTLSMLRGPPVGSVSGVLRAQNSSGFAEEIPVTVPIVTSNPSAVFWDPSVDVDYFPLWSRADMGLTLAGGVTSWPNNGNQPAAFFRSGSLPAPTITASGVGGFLGLSFVAANQTNLVGMNGVSALLGGYSNVAKFVVFATSYTPVSGSTGTLLGESITDATTPSRFTMLITSSGTITAVARPADSDTSAAASSPASVCDGLIHIAMFVFNAGNVTLYIDGVPVATGTGPDAGPFTNVPANEERIGSLQLNPSGVVDTFTGEILEVGTLINPTQDIIDRTNAYVLWLYGRQAALQASAYTGPYASAPPYIQLRDLAISSTAPAAYTNYTYYFTLSGALTMPGSNYTVTAADGSQPVNNNGLWSNTFVNTGTINLTVIETGPLGTHTTTIPVAVQAGAPTVETFTFNQD